MWIQECHQRYNQILSRKTKKPTDPIGLEIALWESRKTKQVGPEELRLIEEDELWPYPDWWPKLSKDFGTPILLPPTLASIQDKERAVMDLLVRIKHIEVVSIVLRFIFPEEFGIMSPPVLRLLNVVPGRDSVRQYLRYLSVLRKLRERYQQSSGLRNIADYDMALWTAAHLEWPDDDDLLSKMDQDKHFQGIRLSNLMEGLGSRWGASIRERLLLARALLSKDHVAAAVIVARCYEQIIRHIGKRAKHPIQIGKKENGVHKQLKELAQTKEVLRRGVKLAELDLWDLRKDAVHGPEKGESDEISKENTKKFLKGVEKLRVVFNATK
ncbi:MAG: hypothetical protein HY647_06960 [Acidobacteria bacterium]|nr:hypothetical protein [Acidobacteriota bacterium]